MKVLLVVCVLGIPAMFCMQAGKGSSMDEMAAETYESLATVIIEVKHTEDLLVKGLLTHYSSVASHHLMNAAKQTGAEQKASLEGAATQISNVATEGDKRVQAIRQRLSKAGHTHNTDAVTKDDYMFIDSVEKKALLDLAKAVGGMAGGKQADIEKSAQEFRAMFDKAIASQ